MNIKGMRDLAVMDEFSEQRSRLHRSDVKFIDTFDSSTAVVDSLYLNDAQWWQNASFALPFLVALISTVVGLVWGIGEATGFGLFAFAVTALMLPIVLITWRNTATLMVLTDTGAYSIHRGKILHQLNWHDLRRIDQVEYLGSSRFKLLHGDNGEFMTVESEIEDGQGLVDRSFRLSGLSREREV